MRTQTKSSFVKKFGLGSARKKTKDGLNEEIQKRAYEIYLSKGGTHGHDVDDWIEAEQQIINSKRKHSH